MPMNLGPVKGEITQNSPASASGHCPRNAAFIRQSGVRPDRCPINAAFRPTAALNLGAVPGFTPTQASCPNGIDRSAQNPTMGFRPETSYEL